MSKWELVKLGDVGQVITGNTPKTSDSSNFASNDILFFKPGDFNNNGITLLADSENYVSKSAKNKIRLLPANSVLVTCIGIIGKVGITNQEATCNQQVNAIIPDKGCCERYIAYAVIQKRNALNHIANAAVVPIVNKTQFSSLEIPLPPLPVQRQIADMLDRASALIEKRKEQIEKLDLLIKSQFIQMFGDPVTNPMGWEQCRLQDFIIFLTSGSRGWSSYFSKEGEMFLTIKNVKNSQLLLENMQYVKAPMTKEAERTRVRPQDLLISITADLGRTAVVTDDVAKHGAYINQHLSLVRLDITKIVPMFASYYFESQAGKRQFDAKNQVGVKSGLNFDAINSLEMLIPPLLLQQSFATFVHRVEAQKTRLQQSLTLLERNYKSLMQKCFRGEIF